MTHQKYLKIVLFFLLSCSNGKIEGCNLLETYEDEYKYIEFKECGEAKRQVVKNAVWTYYICSNTEFKDVW